MPERTEEESARFLRNAYPSMYTTMFLNRKLIRELGLLPATMLNCLMDIEDFFVAQGEISPKGDMFFSESSLRIEKKFNISQEDQKVLVDALISFGILDTSYRGNPVTRYIRIDWDELKRILST
jgi:hypothetical protein